MARLTALLACAGLSGKAAFAQRGGRVGGAGRVGAARIAAPSTSLRRPFYPIRPIYPIGPFSPVFVAPSFGFWGGPYFRFGLGLGPSAIWWQNCYLYGTYGCYSVAPYYVFAGEDRELAQLFLTDGTAYNVTDYWLVDTQLHFKTIEEGGTKVVEHTIDFNQLDTEDHRREHAARLPFPPAQRAHRTVPAGPSRNRRASPAAGQPASRTVAGVSSVAATAIVLASRHRPQGLRRVVSAILVPEGRISHPGGLYGKPA